MKPGMKAKLQLYPYRTRTFIAHVTSIQPAAGPVTPLYTVVLEMENPPDNLMAGSGLAEGNHVVVSDQDKLHPGEPVRLPMVNSPPPPKEP